MNDPNDRESILYAFAVEPNHDRATFERYVRQHPELANELADLSFELRLAAVNHSPAVDPETDIGSKDAWQQFIRCEPQKVAALTADNPFGRFKGETFVELAESLNVTRSILAALRDRLVEPTSIPERFIVRLARSTGSTTESLRKYLALPPGSISTLSFKADAKPAQQGRVTFETLIHSSQLTDEQRQVLLQDWLDDGLDRGDPADG